jgi:hypothetical protein
MTAREPARGVALIVALFTLTLVAAMAAALALGATMETTIGGDFARVLETRYAAEAGLERAIAELPAIGDWNLVVSGAVRSTFVDGPSSGSRALPDGTSLDLTRVATLANAANPAQRPWGANNPVWHLFAHGRVDALLTEGSIRSSCYVVVLAADDPSETDADPAVDGTVPCAAGESPPACNPGSGAIAVRSEAFGPRGAHQVVEAIVERSSGAGAVLRTRAQLMRDVR